MISVIDLMDVERASATPLGCGVVFRWPTETDGALMMASLGTDQPPPDSLPDVSLRELLIQSSGHSFIGYRGSDYSHHYFAMPTQTGVRLRKDHLYIDRMPFQLGFCIFVSFRGSRLVLPSPRRMADVDPANCAWALKW